MSKNDLNEESGFFDGFTIHDCVILSKGYYGVSAEEILPEEEFDYYESRGKSQVGSYSDDRQERGKSPVWGGIVWPRHSFFNTRLVNTELKECLMMDDAGQGYYLGLGDKKFVEDRIPPDQRCHQLTKIGEQIYGIGFGRKIIKRIESGKWEHLVPASIRKAIPSGQAGFDGMHGFNENDLYAAGGKSDVWHFDGQDWRFIDICDDPILPKSVCCAEDGFVYIGCAHGVLVRGRGEEWEVYRPKNQLIKFTEIVSYQGRIFIGSEAGVYVLEHNADSLVYQPYDFEKQIHPIKARRMDVGHGLLLAASEYSVALFDGQQWRYLYGGGPTPEEEAVLLEKMARDAEDSLDTLYEIADKLKSAKGQG